MQSELHGIGAKASTPIYARSMKRSTMVKMPKPEQAASSAAPSSSDETLLSWAGKCAPWRQDALRRHAGAQGHRLSAAEKEAVIERVRHEATFPAAAPPVCTPLEAAHFSGSAGKAPRTLLHSLGPVKHLNRLAPEQTMRFTASGMTIVFGDNGSGKSGYARITKKMCRSLTEDDLLGNVFEKGPKPRAEVIVRHQTDGSDIATETWTDGTPTPPGLATLSVFDSANARLYVDEQNRISYLPREISLLQEHSAHCVEMDEGFKAESTAIQKRVKVPLPAGYSKGGDIEKALARLDIKQTELPKANDFRTLAKAQDGDEAARKQLQEELVNDPSQMAARSRRFKAFMDQYAIAFGSADTLLSAANVETLRTKKSVATTTAQAASLAATERFAASPLKSGIGADPWRLMYEHAKAFVHANGAAEGSLPDAVGDNCALCQEPLTESGAARMKSFNEFVAGETTKAADTARQVLQETVQALRELKLPTKAQIDVDLGDYAAIDASTKSFVEELGSYTDAAIQRRNALGTAAMGDGNFDAIPEMAASIADKLTAESAALEKAAVGLEEAAKSDKARADQRAKLAALQDRKKLADDLPTVLARLADLEAIVQLKKCSDAVGTAPISRQITALRRSLVMVGLKKAIANEIVALDLSHIPFDITDRSVEGQSLIAVDLKSASNVTNSKVLSEGEQRALALACFLAETTTSGGKHGLIIDDPVSSLDHGRIRRVAGRIAAEAAAGKQIIVFTHNILFYNELVDAAARLDPPAPVHRNFISKVGADVFGLISEKDEPWIMVSTSKRIGLLQTLLNSHAGVTDFTSDTWRLKATEFYTQLRETWERLVEEVLLSKVVERFNSDVRTTSLKGVVVSDEDYKIVFFAMKRASERSGHDMAGGKGAPLPTLDEMKSDLEKVSTYFTAVNKRKKTTSDEREKLEKPPKAEVA